MDPRQGTTDFPYSDDPHLKVSRWPRFRMVAAKAETVKCGRSTIAVQAGDFGRTAYRTCSENDSIWEISPVGISRRLSDGARG